MSVVGRCRILVTDLWDQDAVDLVAPGFIEFAQDSTGSLGFIAIQAGTDWAGGSSRRAPGSRVLLGRLRRGRSRQRSRLGDA